MPLHRRQILAVTLFLVTGSVTCQDVSSSTTNSPAPLPTTQQTINKTDSGSADTPSTSAPTVTPAIETSAVNTEQLQNTTTTAASVNTEQLQNTTVNTTTTAGAAGSSIPTNTTKAESVTDIGNVTTITTETGNSEVSTEAVTSPPVEDGTEATNVTAGQAFLAGKVDLQTQVYIISGTFGLVAFLLIVLLLSLALSVSKIKEQILDSESRYVVEREDRIAGYQNGGYSSGQVSSRYQEERSVDGDLKNMGYSIYSGNNRNREENIPMQNVSRSNNMMKYEEGVIPMAEEEDDR